MTRVLLVLSSPLLLLLGGCAATEEVASLRAENARLEEEVARLQAQLKENAPGDPRAIRSFTVGLAASEKSFDSVAFENLLGESLKTASKDASVTVTREPDERQASKIRNMLVQQYLAAEEIPIVISNLHFKLGDQANEFKIGDQLVPRAETAFSKGSAGTVVNAAYEGAISASMHRDAQGNYSIPYEELGGGEGRIEIQTTDLEILDTEQQARAERHGDISFNWNLNLEKIEVYRVESFKGDVGLFLDNMRYSGISSSLGQYQTLRDVVFLFGYGSYRTGLVNQIRTPAYISSVEVAPIDAATFDRLRAGMAENDLLAAIGATSWTSCEFVDFAGAEKVWERPAAVAFPFVSRQTSADRGQVFYLKYSTDGAALIADFNK